MPDWELEFGIVTPVTEHFMRRKLTSCKAMLSGCLTRSIVRALDRVKGDTGEAPAHLIIGRRGEEDAYFYLRRKGYVVVARNYRTARHHGEIDLIGWDKDVLCFIEVKTRTTHDVKPAEAAVDRKKRRDLHIVIRDYLRSLPEKQFPELPQWRFDVVTVYYDPPTAREQDHPHAAEGTNVSPPARKQRTHGHNNPTFELFQNAALSS